WDRSHSLVQVLKDHREQERRMGHTLYGPNRADIRLKFGGRPVAETFSRGQQKTLVILMKIAQGKVLSDLGKQVTFLLDDINAELDVRHRIMLARKLQDLRCQVFITSIEHPEPDVLWADGQARRFFMRISKKPEDITEWGEERVIPFGGNRITYSHPVMLQDEGNRIYMFWRGSDWQPSFSFSDDLGDTWSDPKVLIASKNIKDKPRNRPYLKVHSDGQDRIDFIFTDGHPSVEPTNSVYHFYYKKGMFHQTNGDLIGSIEGPAIKHQHVHKVYAGEKDSIRAWIADVALAKDGNPVVVYPRFPQDTDHRYHYAKWNGNRWLDEEICKAGGWMPIVEPGEKVREPHYSGGISLNHRDPSNVYLSRK